MMSPAQRVLVVLVIDPRWLLELRQKDSLAASPAVLTTINATGVFLCINLPKTRIWLQKVSRRDLKPKNGPQVCSQHFKGGKKTYMNNVPTVFPLSKTHQKINTDPQRTLIRVNTLARMANTIPSDRSSEGVIEGGKELTDLDAPLAAEPIHLEEKLDKLKNDIKELCQK